MTTIEHMIDVWEHRDAWELYIFPGGKVGECKTRFRARLWMWLNFYKGIERRAIHTRTKEHIVG